MTPTRDSLLRAVLENPAEDTPRLVYADWLDEYGSARDRARAELIRLQLAPFGPACPPRVSEVLRKWGVGWLPPWGRRAAASGGWSVAMSSIRAGTLFPGHYVFRGGFVDQLEIVNNAITRTDGNTLGQPFSGEMCGRAMAQLLAGNPASRFVLSVEGCKPEVVFEFARAGERWVCEAEAAQEEYVAGSRRVMLAGLPAFAARVLERVEFQRRADVDLGGDGDEPEPDWDEIGEREARRYDDDVL